MARTVRVLCFLLACCLVQGLTELFCKDPDTGEFHAVNKTWSSTTVCGNYTCRIRRKVKTDMDVHASDVQIVTALPSDVKDVTNEATVIQNTESDINITQEKNMDENKTKIEEHNRNLLQILQADSKGADRFLSDNEVKTISELLHMVKKSDLEAVVEVYNLAQDIYKEIESAPIENKEEVYKHVLSKLKSDRPPKLPKEKSSYWYDPQLYLEAKDAQPAASEIVNKHIYSVKPDYPSKPYYYNTPYYYPVSTFHRHASYMHPRRQIPQHNWEYYRAPNTNPCPYARSEQTTLLPYPFTPVNQHNYTSPYRAYWAQQNTYKTPPTPYTPYTPMMQAYIEEPKKAVLVNPEIHNNVDIEYPIKEDATILHKAMPKEKSKKEEKKSLFDADDILPLWLTAPLTRNHEEKLAPWQTAPLGEHVLEEVKANILENREKLLFPFKKLKLEKVAKVLKVDNLTRPKRELIEIVKPVVIDEFDFEVYIEKITCDMDTELGLYTVGNQTAPFPECCPKRVKNLSNP